MNTWQLTIENVGDGSGDGYMDLPKELLKKMDWQLDDTIYFKVSIIGEVQLINISKAKRVAILQQ